MEPLFENRFIIDKDSLNEFNCNYSKIIPCGIIFSVLAAAGLALYFILKIDELLFVSCILLGAALSLFFTPSHMTRNTMRLLEEQCRGMQPEQVLRFYEDRAEGGIAASGAAGVYDYANMKKLITTKHLFIIVTKAKNGIMLRRDSFAKGAEADFPAFINEKLGGK